MLQDTLSSDLILSSNFTSISHFIMMIFFTLLAFVVSVNAIRAINQDLDNDQD